MTCRPPVIPPIIASTLPVSRTLTARSSRGSKWWREASSSRTCRIARPARRRLPLPVRDRQRLHVLGAEVLEGSQLGHRLHVALGQRDAPPRADTAGLEAGLAAA